jgi:hypothetical protein
MNNMDIAMNHLSLAVTFYQAVKDRIRDDEKDIDDQTLADTVEGLTDLHEILAAIIRSALTDEALATGLRGRIKEMQERLARLEERAGKRRQIAREAMLETAVKKVMAPDFTVSLRPGTPSLVVVDEAVILEAFWEPQAPRLKRQELVGELKQGRAIQGAELSNPEPILERKEQVMGFSAKQLHALRRDVKREHIRSRISNGRELSYIEGAHAIAEANRIFGFDGWDRETVESRCVMARENRGTFLVVYTAKVRLTVREDGEKIVREGHGCGEARGDSAGEAHDLALKTAETDAIKRALATFGKPFGLALYHGAKATKEHPVASPANNNHGSEISIAPQDLAAARPAMIPIDKSQLKFGAAKRHRDKAHLRFVASQPCLLCGKGPSDPHHLRFAQPRALGMKVSDEFTVPLCRTHHRELHHSGNENVWWHDMDIEPIEIARTLWLDSIQKRARSDEREGAK